MATESESEKLAGELLGEISEEVFDLTGGDRYRAGQPLQDDPSVEKPAADGPPVSEQAEATATEEAKPAAEEAAPETPRDEKGRFTKAEPEPEWFLPGLYKTKEEAIKGIHETKRYASDAVDRANAAKTEPPVEEVDPLSDLENYGVPKDVMSKAITVGAQKALRELLEPMTKRIDADRKIVSMYPDYEKNFTDLAAFVESEPELMQKVNRAEAAGEFLLARELAWLNYERFTASKAERAKTTTRGQQVERAKETMADAAVTKPSQAESRTRPAAPSPNDIPDEKFADLLELAKAGYPTPLWKSTIGATLEREYPSVFGPTPTP